MFTGIVQKLAKIKELERDENLVRLSIELDQLSAGLELGASVAINGVCLTVSKVKDGISHFDVIPETLATTNLDLLTSTSFVNVERSYKVGDEIGGHLVSGHVGSTAVLKSVHHEKHDRVLTFQIDEPWMKFIFHKGFVALDGASLTISSVNRAENSFSVSLIPETLARTTLGLLEAGGLVNIEVEAQTVSIVETVERVMAERE